MATIQCVRCGRSAEQMQKPPTGGKTGQMILEQVCSDCWQEWVGWMACRSACQGLNPLARAYEPRCAGCRGRRFGREYSERIVGGRTR